MATRTAKGTAKNKVSGTTLTLSTVSCNAGDALIVFVGNQTQNVPTSVTWGLRELTKTAHVVNATSGLTASIWIARKLVNTDTRDITVTWGTAVVAKAMAASTLDNGHIRDEFVTTTQQATAAPSIGPTAALSTVDGFGFGLLVAEGPSSDVAPSVSASPTDWIVGQSDGVVGAPPVSNVTIHEFYKQLTNNNALTLSTSAGASPEVPRDWASILVGYRVIGDLIPLDQNGIELVVGDTVSYQGSEATITSIDTGGTSTKICHLSNGESLFSYLLDLEK